LGEKEIEVQVINEGEETEHFWELLGGRMTGFDHALMVNLR
jgi:hypothetical protein